MLKEKRLACRRPGTTPAATPEETAEKHRRAGLLATSGLLHAEAVTQQGYQYGALGEFRNQYAREHTHAGKAQTAPSKLLESDHGERMDTRAQGAASRVNLHMATVG